MKRSISQDKVIATEQGLFYKLRVVDRFTQLKKGEVRFLEFTTEKGTGWLGCNTYIFDFKRKVRLLTPLCGKLWFAHKLSQLVLQKSDIKTLTAFGLGCGSGLTQLLALIPELRIKVIEIDPVIIKLAREHFAPIRRFEKNGRLEIIQADAHEWLTRDKLRENIGDCVFIDLTTDSPESTNAFFEPLFQCYVDNKGDFEIFHNQQFMLSDVTEPHDMCQIFLKEKGYESYFIEGPKHAGHGKAMNYFFSTLKDEQMKVATTVHMAALSPLEKIELTACLRAAGLS